MKRQAKRPLQIYPGEILAEEWVKPNGLTFSQLSDRIGIPALTVSSNIKGRRASAAETALRLGRFFGTGERFWLNLQQAYDVESVKKGLGSRLMREVEPLVTRF